jgi:hypothetical protein
VSDAEQQALNELLADAKLAAAYGQRIGKLRSTDIFEAIAAFQALSAKSWASREAVALQTALNQAIVDIAPTTLLDLREKDPFNPKNKQSLARRYSLIAMSILLMGITAFFTVLYNQGTDLIARLENVDKSRPSEKMAAVAREWQQAKFEDGGKPAEAGETYYKMLDELRELDREVKAGLGEYAELASWMPLLRKDMLAATPHSEAIAPAAIAATLTTGPSAAKPAAADGSATREFSQPPAAPGAASSSPPAPLATVATGDAPNEPLPPGMIPADPKGVPQGGTDCAGFDEPTQKPSVAYSDFMKVPPGKTLSDNKRLVQYFACAESLMISPYDMPYFASLESEIRKTLNVYGLWILPALYGALGAMIFYMRAVLNPVLTDPPIDKIIHRVALGGFAGIIFAWFWAPTPDTMEKFVGLTVNSFAIAFVIGFSIDVFFALLDKLVTFLQGVVNDPRPSPPAKPG